MPETAAEVNSTTMHLTTTESVVLVSLLAVTVVELVRERRVSTKGAAVADDPLGTDVVKP